VTRARDQHLAWCKSRALEILDAGDISGACTSMLSDLTKWTEPLYKPATLALLAWDGMMFCKTSAAMRHWIEGFN
jgi:hypothetical protein